MTKTTFSDGFVLLDKVLAMSGGFVLILIILIHLQVVSFILNVFKIVNITSAGSISSHWTDILTYFTHLFSDGYVMLCEALYHKECQQFRASTSVPGAHRDF